MTTADQPGQSTTRSALLDAATADWPDRAPIGDQIYEELLSRLLSSHLGPGERVTIDALGRELGVSQTPIREALHRLRADGVVVRTQNSGYRVAPKMTRDQFEELVEIRLLLEPAAARRAAEHITPTMAEQLRELSRRMESVQADDNAQLAYAVFSRLDSEFHDRVADGARNRYIRDSLARLHTHVHLFRLSNHAQITSLAVQEHDEVVAAITARDADAAAYAMRLHVQESARRFRRSFAEGTTGSGGTGP